jgi:hypothetical protein
MSALYQKQTQARLPRCGAIIVVPDAGLARRKIND